MSTDCHSEAINLPCGKGLTYLASTHKLSHLQEGAFSDFCLKYCTQKDSLGVCGVFLNLFFLKLCDHFLELSLISHPPKEEVTGQRRRQD